ncbi:hypothetical protein DPMN_016375 [Dreissena polymorpha]|uniref:Uncharacterized protein n=1 Tax=Dreissena polymorpha TaxID=45954 RepID=A0A9D4S6D8_DREPO|nr:hypothetical protein DPMN_016375 [Dreissena polymorpha]
MVKVILQGKRSMFNLTLNNTVSASLVESVDVDTLRVNGSKTSSCTRAGDSNTSSWDQSMSIIPIGVDDSQDEDEDSVHCYK